MLAWRSVVSGLHQMLGADTLRTHFQLGWLNNRRSTQYRFLLARSVITIIDEFAEPCIGFILAQARCAGHGKRCQMVVDSCLTLLMRQASTNIQWFPCPPDSHKSRINKSTKSQHHGHVMNLSL